MGCFEDEIAIAKKTERDSLHLKDVKNELKESMININQTIDKVKTWDKLINLKEESIENMTIMKTKTIKNEYSDCKCFFYILGFIFCIIQLICVQISIIILNSLFDEIVEELKLWFDKTPRKYNFYENLEINSYRELPEIDVAMITSSVGIVFLKNFGFICSNITFQLLSSIWFLLLFLLFDFHIEDKLLDNYTSMELVILILSYILLSFLVGGSSTIALKEFIDKYYYVYQKHEKKGNGEKAIFYIFSGISSFLAVLINRKIFTSYDKTSKWILKWISIICFISFGISNIFYCLYSIPIITNEKVIKNENEKEDKKDKDYETGRKISETDEIKPKTTDPEIITIKSGQSSQQNREEEEKEKEKEKKKKKEEKKELYSTKICTFCGYIYLSRKNSEKSSCICIYYTTKCTWFKEKVLSIDIVIPFIIQLYCQICTMGFNPILTKKLLNEFSYSKNIKFYIALIILSLFFGILWTYIFMSDDDDNEDEDHKKLKKRNFSLYKVDKYFVMAILPLMIFSIFTFISSVCYYTDENTTRERWNNIIMTEFILFKILDLQILSFFDFFENSDIFNTTLAITFEKLIWMIIETIFDAFIENKKSLVLVQIIITSITSFISVLIIICFIIFLFN